MNTQVAPPKGRPWFPHRFVIRKSSEAHLCVDELYQLLQNLLCSDIAVQHICDIIDFWLEGPWRWVQMAYEILNKISQWGLGIVSFRFIGAYIILKRENIRLTPQYIHKTSQKRATWTHLEGCITARDKLRCSGRQFGVFHKRICSTAAIVPWRNRGSALWKTERWLALMLNICTHYTQSILFFVIA